MHEFVFKKAFGDINLNGRKITFDHKATQYALEDFKKRVDKHFIRGEYRAPILDKERSMDRCVVIRHENAAVLFNDFKFDEKSLTIFGKVTGPASDKVDLSKTIDLKMRAVTRPRIDDKNLTEVIRIISFDLCSDCLFPTGELT